MRGIDDDQVSQGPVEAHPNPNSNPQRAFVTLTLTLTLYLTLHGTQVMPDHKSSMGDSTEHSLSVVAVVSER